MSWSTATFFFIKKLSKNSLPVKNEVRANNSIRKIATGQEDDYTIGCLLDYAYFKEKYELIAVALRK